MTETFDRQVLLDIMDGDEEAGEVVIDEVYSNSRWSILHFLIFKKDGKLYSAPYSVGATEYQDEYPFEREERVVCTEMEEYQKTTTAYRAKPGQDLAAPLPPPAPPRAAEQSYSDLGGYEPR